ncbi:hypothetical protein [Streptomonospora litoralis]|uniref:Uncharacterized protein n=1 Tax=Streptomonospora litoralis TaxID=2498135 RepID=A0A4P6PZ68_9ACTN|nr:hypothetical protein [Streptomonospora litoralis]QBI53485.1 hypothetical protein EKD16_08455 [Streptomonospora litoralis]
MASRNEPDQPPEARLIRERREAMLISPETLSRRIHEAGYDRGVSGRRLREIEEGRTRAGKPTAAPALTLVQVALTLGITAADLDEVGRADAAAIMRNHLKGRIQQEPEVAALPGVSEELRQQIIQGLDELRAAPDLTREQKAQLEAAYLRSLSRSAEAARDQLQETIRTFRGDSE